jgi:archaeal flagellar protein FlaCE
MSLLQTLSDMMRVEPREEAPAAEPEEPDGEDEDGAMEPPEAESEAGPTVEEAVSDVEYRVDELATDLDQTMASVEALEASQAEMADRLDEVDDRIRSLLGIYDRLTDDVNPFSTGPGANGSGPGFGVVETRTNGSNGRGDGSNGQGETTDAVSFDDLEVGSTDPEGTEPVPGDEPAESLEPLEPAESAESAEPTSDDTVPEEGLDGDALERMGPDPGEAVLIETFPEGFAADLVAMEWLSGLVTVAGPAGALKAVAYYRTIDWIGEEVHDHLEDVLSGPALDAAVDPAGAAELSVAEHAESYRFVLTLSALVDLDAHALTEIEDGL